MYENDMVKVTLQIGEPEAMQLKMDVAITFADALGIVGKKGTGDIWTYLAKYGVQGVQALCSHQSRKFHLSN